MLDRVAERHHFAPHRLSLLNSAYLAAGRRPVSERALRDAVPYATRSRLGAEHRQPLLGAGFAREVAEGWVMTEAGLDAVAELHREVRREIARCDPGAALVGRVGEILERLSYATPRTTRGASSANCGTTSTR